MNTEAKMICGSSTRPFIRLGLMGLIACLIAGGLVAIAIVLRGHFSETEGRILATVAALAIFSGIALPSLIHLERGRYALLAGLGGLGALASFAAVMHLAWGEAMVGGFPRPAATFALAAFSAGHVSLMLFATSRRGLVYTVLKGSISVIVAVAVILTVVIWTEDVSNAMLRALWTLIVLDVLGTISVPILSAIVRATTHREGGS